MDKALEIISGLKDNWLKTLLSVLVALPLIFNGIYQTGIDAGLWSRRVGKLEQVNAKLAMKYITEQPEQVIPIIETEDDHLVIKVYKTGDALVVRRVVDPLGEMSQRQHWITKTEIDKLLAWNINLTNKAYAGVKGGGVDFQMEYEDEVIEVVDEYHVKVKRTYSNGCIDTFIMDIATGEIVDGTHERNC